MFMRHLVGFYFFFSLNSLSVLSIILNSWGMEYIVILPRVGPYDKYFTLSDSEV